MDLRDVPQPAQNGYHKDTDGASGRVWASRPSHRETFANARAVEESVVLDPRMVRQQVLTGQMIQRGSRGTSV